MKLNRSAQSLTVLIPCKNERRNIRACVESVRTVADEILVADSGSTDGTLDTAECSVSPSLIIVVGRMMAVYIASKTAFR